MHIFVSRYKFRLSIEISGYKLYSEKCTGHHFIIFQNLIPHVFHLTGYKYLFLK